MDNPTMHPQETYLSLLISMNHTMTLLDELKTTKAYSSKIKDLTDQLLARLKEYTKKDFTALMDNGQDELLFTVMDAQEEIVKRLVHLRVHDIAVINAILNEYTKDPDKIMQALDLQFVEST